MEADDGGRLFSVPEQYQIPGSFTPVTLIKPDSMPIYAGGRAVRSRVGYLEDFEVYTSGFSHQNLAQGLQPSSASYAETRHLSSSAAAGAHRVDGYLPRWNYEVQRMGSDMPMPYYSHGFWRVGMSCINQQGQANGSQSNRLNQNAMALPLQDLEEQLDQMSHIKFADLLQMNQLGFTSGMLLGDGSTKGSFIVDSNSPFQENNFEGSATPLRGSSGMLLGSTQDMSSNRTPEIQHRDVPCYDYGNLYFPKSAQSTLNSFSNANRNVCAPATPDRSKLISERKGLSTVQQYTVLDQVAVLEVNPLGLQNEAETPPGSGASPGKISTPLENHNLDKGSTEGFDLNKTPQQKPRRKKHRPKVVSEDKPKRASKPHTPKPTNPTEQPRAKRKYVRKNKTNISSTTPAGSSEVQNPKLQTPTPVNSCRRSLNFDLDEHVDERNLTSRSILGNPPTSMCKSSYDSYSMLQANTVSPLEIPMRQNIHSGKAVTQRLNATEPRVKTKYVRKNKTHISSTTPAESGEVQNPKLQTPTTVNSCRRSLNFDLYEHVEEGNSTSRNILGNLETSVCKSSYDSYSALQENTVSASEIPMRQAIHSGKETVTQRLNAATAYDLSCSVNQQLKEYIQLPQEETPDSACLAENTAPQPYGMVFTGHQNSRVGNNKAVTYPMEECREGLIKADTHGAQSTYFRTRESPVDGEQRPKRTFSDSIDVLDETRKLAAFHGACCSPNHLTLGDRKINRITNILFPDICKKRRSEKAQSVNPTCATSSATNLEDVRQLGTKCDSSGGSPTTSQYDFRPPVPQSPTAQNDLAEAAQASYRTKLPSVHKWTDIQKFEKKRSKAPIHISDLVSLTEAEHTGIDIPIGNQAHKYVQITEDVLNSPLPCLEPLVTENPKPRTKKRSMTRFTNSDQSNHAKEAKLQEGIVMNVNHKSIGNSTDLPWSDMSIYCITEGLKKLDMNREGSNMVCTQENALVPYCANGWVEGSFGHGQSSLVLYEKDGTVVPFEGPFNPVKKRNQRAKVDLDEETTKVWKLLLENIDNAGIDGTDEGKVKWWEEERRVFHGRVDFFIARMRLVQGDRRFSPWKGSVVDSVIGVFLTQNVSDHLSSSAFMSLAAHFPIKSRSKVKISNEGMSASPTNSTLDLECVKMESAKSSDEHSCYRDSRTLYQFDHGEEKEAVISKEVHERKLELSQQDTHGLVILNSSKSSQKLPIELVERHNNYIIDMETASGDARAIDDITSSQHSALSSLASNNSTSGPTAGSMGSSPERNSEVEVLIMSPYPSFPSYPSSYVEHLKMAEIPIPRENLIIGGSHSLWYQGSTDNEAQGKEIEQQQKRGLRNEIHGSSPTAPNILSNSIMHLRMDAQLQGANIAEMVNEETRSSDNSATKDDNCTTEQSDLINESTHLSLLQEISEKSQKPISSTENVCSHYVYAGERMILQSQRSVTGIQEATTQPANEQRSITLKIANVLTARTHCESESIQVLDHKNSSGHNGVPDPKHNARGSTNKLAPVENMKQTKGKAGKAKKAAFDWDSLRKHAEMNGRKRERTAHTLDSLDYEAVRCSDVNEIADTIKERGMNNMLAERIKDFLNRLVTEHGSIDLEWLRDVPPDKAKEYLLSIRGLGLKSVECVRLLTLHHLAFPVDTNVGRIAVRLGWVPLQPLPESLQLHLLELYPVLESIQKYLWPRLCKLDQRTLYELHYHMITFGKVFCTKRQPNCNACPLRGECRHFASAFASARAALPGPEERNIISSTQGGVTHQDPQSAMNPTALSLPQAIQQLVSDQCGYHDPLLITSPIQALHSASAHPHLEHQDTQENRKFLPLPQPQEGQYPEVKITNCEPIIEVPASPEPEQKKTSASDMEDMFYEDPNEIPVIKLNMQQFTQTLESYMQSQTELQQSDMSKELVTLTAEAASIPVPKLKNVNRLRTEHQVYELPDIHPLLEGLEKREPDDPCSYLLAIWTPGETANSTQPPEQRCNTQEPGQLCDDESCIHCNSQREVNSQIVRGTLLIPCRTAMRGSFPLNGTYFQVNEVFADHDSSLDPIAVPRKWIWNLPRRTVYFGTSIPTIFRGLSTEGIEHCFWRGYVCVRGFDQKTRAPRPLMARLHFPASKMTKPKGKPKDQHSAT